MKLTTGTPSRIDFSCNICGAANSIPTISFHRELAQCVGCGATPRFRGIVRGLALGLGIDASVSLHNWPEMKHIHGLGMSDWDGYAQLLSRKFNYSNTFYDRAPQLDIQSPSPAQLGSLDFVISTDVFEHILPPLQRAFDNLYALLKPGGYLLFSVPYTREGATLEHFADLCEFEFIKFRGTSIMVNRNSKGRLAVYENLVFHGGEGATLEMRLYCEDDIVRRLGAAGFVDIQIFEQPDLTCGYYWPPLPQADPAAALCYAYVIGARRPVGASR